jgi:hypothetical protein
MPGAEDMPGGGPPSERLALCQEQDHSEGNEGAAYLDQEVLPYQEAHCRLDSHRSRVARHTGGLRGVSNQHNQITKTHHGVTHYGRIDYKTLRQEYWWCLQWRTRDNCVPLAMRRAA